MEQDIRFCPVGRRRLAYSTVGEGPLLVLPTWWPSHLELDWAQKDSREFFLQLAQHRTVLRYDRIGMGLSDRNVRPADVTLESELLELEILVDHLGVERVDLLALSCAAPLTVLYAHRHPGRAGSIVFYNAYASGADLASEALSESIVAIARADWGVGSRLIASLFAPSGTGTDISRVARVHRAAVSGEMAARFFELDFAADIRALAPQLRARTLVLHRRSGAVVPVRLGQELASLIPDARFVPLRGRDQFPWSGDSRDVLRAIASFLEAEEPSMNGSSPLTRRETEVLRLVAAGLNNREIASSLVVSEHTVHRHMANILRKLAQSSRAAAAAHGARVGLI